MMNIYSEHRSTYYNEQFYDTSVIVDEDIIAGQWEKGKNDLNMHFRIFVDFFFFFWVCVD